MLMHAFKCRHRKFWIKQDKITYISREFVFQVRFEGLQKSIALEFYQFEAIFLHESFPQTG